MSAHTSLPKHTQHHGQRKIVVANRRGEWEGEGESQTSKLWGKIMNLRSGWVSFEETC